MRVGLGQGSRNPAQPSGEHHRVRRRSLRRRARRPDAAWRGCGSTRTAHAPHGRARARVRRRDVEETPRSRTYRARSRLQEPAATRRDLATRRTSPLTPRSRSASATASAGRTCPAVPPAAIRHTSLDDFAIDGDVKENADSGEEHHEARAAVGDERQRDPGERRDPEHGREIHRRLPADESRQAGREQLPERIAAAQRDAKADEGEGARTRR